MIGTLALVFACFCVMVCVAQQPLEGDWVGGIDFGKDWQSINFHFKNERERITGTLDLPQQGRNALPLNSIVSQSSRVRIEWQGRSGLAIYDGEFKDGGIVGDFQQGGTRGTFILARVARVDPKIYDQYAGSYQIGPDRFLDIGPDDDSEGRPRFLDSKTDRFGVLYPSSDFTFFSGPSLGIPLPVDVRVTFIKNRRGDVTSLKWQEGGAAALIAKKVYPYKKEKVIFNNGDAVLAGTLISPATKGPHPALVLVSPGYSLERNNGVYPYFFIRQGLAVLSLDQRTVNGVPVDYAQSSFEERARDVLAGVRLLKARKDIKPKQIGLWGSSISAWIAPLAATLSPDVAFLIPRCLPR